MEKLNGNCFYGCTLNNTSRRFSGNVFGINGVLCYSHYRQKYREVKRKEGFLSDFNIQSSIKEIGDYYANKANKKLLERLKQSEECDRICYEILKQNYTVDLTRGIIKSNKTNEIVKSYFRTGGRKYRFLRLHYNGKRISIRLHRALGMFKFGLEAIIGKEVGHKDKNPENNTEDNLEIYNSRKEHLEKDRVGPGLTPGVDGRKQSWPPCIKCGNKNGNFGDGHKSPRRYNGKPYGFDGELCLNCYSNIRRRVRAGQEPVQKEEPIKPCGCCGDLNGYIPKGCSKPSRLDGSKFGFSEKICHRCYVKHNDQLRKANTQIEH